MVKTEANRGFWDGIPLSIMMDGDNYSDPQFSPDGRFIAYLRGIEGGNHLFIYGVESGTHYQLTSTLPLSTGTPYGGGRYCWRSDSSGIIFTSKGQLYNVNVDGGIPKKLLSIDKSFAPCNFEQETVFSVEHENSMSIAILEDMWPQKIKIDADFLYDAKINKKNGDIAVHTWNFPNMSWNGSEIRLLSKSNNYHAKIIAGSKTEATSQPSFSPDGSKLAFNCDRNGWLNLWVADINGENIRALITAEEEHAYSTWVTGDRNYQWTDDSKYIIHTFNKNGFVSLAVVEVDSGSRFFLDVPDGNYSYLSSVGDKLVCIYSNHTYKEHMVLFTLDFSNGVKVANKKVLVQSGLAIPKSMKSLFTYPKEYTYPTVDGNAHMMFYALPDDKGEMKDLPVIFLIHGGPTGMFLNKFHMNVQYYTSRGWAVAAINHRGSIGYGRKYRESLNGNWGIHDVEDTRKGFEFLANEGIINPNKSLVMGGSAGGYTTLMMMASYPDLMVAGVNLFGVADLIGLAEDTHYLESQYDKTLVGNLPEDAATYRDRSPLYIAEKITRPLMILQGSDDPVVVKAHSDKIAEAVKGPVEYKVYEGEGHGFRKKANIEDMFKRIDKFIKNYVLYS